MSKTVEKVTLYFREGGADKVYSASIENKRGDDHVVNYSHGRRGSTMKPGTKTPQPVPYDKAKKIYDKLVKSKTNKGYTPGEDGKPFVATENEGRDTGLRPQLLNFIEESELTKYINDDSYLAQEKHDGNRALVKKAGVLVIGTNRRGLEAGLCEPILQDAGLLDEDLIIIDGESIGDTLFAFDLLACGRDLREDDYVARLSFLENIFKRRVGFSGAIKVVDTMYNAKDKRKLLNRLRKEGKEGIVFKLRSSKHKPGRPTKGGDWVKFKFYATATCRVAEGRAGKRSVALEMDIGDWVSVGNVTVPANQPIPKVGDFVEVRYLYAYRGGSLFQPTLLGIRTDATKDDCALEQLKYKAEALTT